MFVPELLEQYLFGETSMFFSEVAKALSAEDIESMRTYLESKNYCFDYNYTEDELVLRICEEYVREMALTAIKEDYAYFDDLVNVAKTICQ